MSRNKFVILILAIVSAMFIASCVMDAAEEELIVGDDMQQVVAEPVAGTCSCIVPSGWSIKRGTDTCATCTSSSDCSYAGCTLTKDSNPAIESDATCKWSSGTVSDDPIDPIPVEP